MGALLPYDFISLEGYLNAKLFMAILQRMGADPQTPADLAATACWPWATSISA